MASAEDSAPPHATTLRGVSIQVAIDLNSLLIVHKAGGERGFDDRNHLRLKLVDGHAAGALRRWLLHDDCMWLGLAAYPRSWCV